MNRPMIIVAFIFFMLSHERLSAEETKKEAELHRAVAEFSQAFVKADESRLGELLTENYLHINGNSGTVLDRNQWLSWIKTRKRQLEDGDLVVIDYRIEELKVVLHGETAVVTGLVSSSGIRSGVKFSSRIRFSNTWVLHDGRWRRAAFHDSPAPLANPAKK